MRVFKFGGASVKNSIAVKNVASLVGNSEHGKLLIVVSAMGKTTNALEEVVSFSLKGKDFSNQLKSVQEYHTTIVEELFPDPSSTLIKLKEVFHQIIQSLKIGGNQDFVYDQVVSQGEILSTIIVADFISTQLNATWVDAREFITTDETFREGKVDWLITKNKTKKLHDILKRHVVITQGFIGRSANGETTTLGREGSDYSAAIFAACLDAESVTIWKDVPGVMTADPKRSADAKVFSELPYQEAAEMTYYGASVIHPKTIKPLANANIPLYVKNFDDPSLPGTKIHECRLEHIPPLIVFKENQCLISCKVTDYTFISEDQLSNIFKAISEHEVKINMMQNSAISFSFCCDFRESKVHPLIEKLKETFEVYYNTDLTLITIKNYSEKLAEEYRKKPGILLEQLSRSTLQLLVRLM
jgi:aspartate kinase